MFTNTFDKIVIDLFQLRSTFSALTPLQISSQLTSSDITKYLNWLGRTPFVLAYSNVRYPESGSDGIYNNMKYSVLSSFAYTGSNVLDIVVKKDFNDFYLNKMDLGFGIHSNPTIKSLEINGRGKNGTLKDITLTINCYNYLQFFNVRNYFAVPCTSIFIQYGYYVNDDLIGSTIFPPILCNGTLTFPKDVSDTYLSQKTIGKKYDKSIHIDSVMGIVYGFDINQLGGMEFLLIVKMMTKGVSLILNYIKPQYTIETTTKKGTTESVTIHNKDLVNSMYAWANDPTFAKNGLSIALTTTNLKYVTYNWITNLPILGLRKEINKAFTNSTTADWVPSLELTIFMFKVLPGFNANLISNNKDVIIINGFNDTKTPLKAKRFYVTSSLLIIDTQRDYYNKAFELTKTTKTIKQDEYLSNFRDLYKEQFDKFLEYKTNINSNGHFGWLGNVYIRLEAVALLLRNAETLTLDNFITGINNMIMQAFGGVMSVGFTYNNRKEIFEILQTSLHYALSKNIYYVPNFGERSIVKNITYQLKMPDGYKATIFQAYGANGGIMNKLFQLMFRGGKPKDILLFKGVPEATIGGLLVTVDYQKLSTTLFKNLAILYNSNKKLIENVLQNLSTKQSINKYNTYIIEVEKDKIKKDTGSRGLSSIYSTLILLTFDFIANIDWGQVFKLEFNPLGWLSKFFVNNVRQRVDADTALTVVKGFMFG